MWKVKFSIWRFYPMSGFFFCKMISNHLFTPRLMRPSVQNINMAQRYFSLDNAFYIIYKNFVTKHWLKICKDTLLIKFENIRQIVHFGGNSLHYIKLTIVPSKPFIEVLTFLYNFPAHGGVDGTWYKWVCLVIKEVCTAFVIKGVALVTFDGSIVDLCWNCEKKED